MVYGKMIENMDFVKKFLNQVKHLKVNIKMENHKEKEFILKKMKNMTENG